MTIFERLVQALRSASAYNSQMEAIPACVLWTDPERQWEKLLPRLKDKAQELFELGDYAPRERRGPAIWLRSVLAASVPGATWPKGSIPVLYLPGVARQTLRDVDKCPDPLKPLVTLLYSGTDWMQVNSKDWTIAAFLQNPERGLGLKVSPDGATKEELKKHLLRLSDENIDRFRGQTISASFIQDLVVGNDPVRQLLRWLDNPDGFKKELGPEAWSAFRELCSRDYGVDPQTQGALSAVAKLAEGKDHKWKLAWERFVDSPGACLGIPELLKKAAMPPADLLANVGSHGKWPQWNEGQESTLRGELGQLATAGESVARESLKAFAAAHLDRRELVWAKMGLSPLAQAVAALAQIAEISGKEVPTGDLDSMASAYGNQAWAADAAVLQAMGCVSSPEDRLAVQTAVQAVYAPWADRAARALQKLALETYPGAVEGQFPSADAEKGLAVFFVDALRWDLAERLTFKLSLGACKIERRPYWTALPSITATAKVAVSPARPFFKGPQTDPEFDPQEKESGSKGSYAFNKCLEQRGWQVLKDQEVGDSSGQAWLETGEIDTMGHQQPAKLGKDLEGLLQDIADRVERLLNAGWKKVRIVTDHGFLYLPGGLSKVELPTSLTRNKWGRCATIKDGSSTDVPRYPWFWHPQHFVAMPPGIACFANGYEYSHGGLSLQECLLQELTVTSDYSKVARQVKIEKIEWKGMRIYVTLAAEGPQLRADLRKDAEVAGTSLALNKSPKAFDGHLASLVVEQEGMEGKQAVLVLLDENDKIVAQTDVAIGGAQ